MVKAMLTRDSRETYDAVFAEAIRNFPSYTPFIFSRSGGCRNGGTVSLASGKRLPSSLPTKRAAKRAIFFMRVFFGISMTVDTSEIRLGTLPWIGRARSGASRPFAVITRIPF